jgi:hypothetical protein
VASTRGKKVEVPEDQDKDECASAPCVIFSDAVFVCFITKNLCCLHQSLSAVYVIGQYVFDLIPSYIKREYKQVLWYSVTGKTICTNVHKILALSLVENVFMLLIIPVCSSISFILAKVFQQAARQ